MCMAHCEIYTARASKNNPEMVLTNYHCKSDHCANKFTSATWKLCAYKLLIAIIVGSIFRVIQQNLQEAAVTQSVGVDYGNYYY